MSQTISSDFENYFNWCLDRWDMDWKRFGGQPDFRKKRVLDFGSGAGAFAMLCAKNGATQVVALDLNEEIVKKGRELIERRDPGLPITYVTEPIETVSEKFDLIISHEVLEHVENLELTLRLLCEHLEPNGTMFLAWGPLWRAPLGGHQMTKRIGRIPIPYSHFVLCWFKSVFVRPRVPVKKLINDAGLNGLTFREYASAFNNSDLAIVSWKENVGENWAYRALSWLSKIWKDPFTSNVYGIFELRSKPSAG